MITTTRMRSSNGTRVLFISRESGKDANKRCRKESSSRTQNVLDRNYLTKKLKSFKSEAAYDYKVTLISGHWKGDRKFVKTKFRVIHGTIRALES